MKSLTITILLFINALSFAQDGFNAGYYTNCDGSGMSSNYFIQFNQDSTFFYSKEIGLSVDQAVGFYSVNGNSIKLDFEPVERDSAYILFSDSLNQLDSVLIPLTCSNLLMKRPSQLYLIKKKVFLHQPKNNREARRSKFYLVREKDQYRN